MFIFQAAVGANYRNGYPVLRLHRAKILESQLQAEENMLRLLDLHFPDNQEPSILPTDTVADLDDSVYRTVVVEPKEIVPALHTPDQWTCPRQSAPISARTLSPASAALYGAQDAAGATSTVRR